MLWLWHVLYPQLIYIAIPTLQKQRHSSRGCLMEFRSIDRGQNFVACNFKSWDFSRWIFHYNSYGHWKVSTIWGIGKHQMANWQLCKAHYFRQHVRHSWNCISIDLESHVRMTYAMPWGKSYVCLVVGKILCNKIRLELYAYKRGIGVRAE